VYALWYKHIAYDLVSSEMLSIYYPIESLFLISIGPLMLLYVYEIFGRTVKLFSTPVLLHCISAIPALSYLFWYSQLQEQDRILLMIANKEQLDIFRKFIIVFFLVQVQLYIFYGYYYVSMQLKERPRIILDGVILNMLWLRPFLRFSTIVILLCLIACIISESDKMVIVFASVVLIIECMYIFWKSVSQTGVFMENTCPGTKHPSEKISALDNEADEHLHSLLHLLYSEKLFLNQDINLLTIASKLNIHPHYLSNIINRLTGKNFNDFINEYRIEFAKSQIEAEGDSYTIEAIGYQSGFGSKSSFYTAFKKHCGTTPAEYKKSIINATPVNQHNTSNF
jgi:AraC-like DNA-binding protein